MKRLIGVCLMLLVAILSHAQDQKVVHFQFLDKKTGDQVPNVNLTITTKSGETLLRTAGFTGELKLTFPYGERLSVAYTHRVYESGETTVDVKGNEDTIQVVVDLVSQRIQYVGEVVVKPVGVPYEVYGSQRVSVADFEIQPDGRLLLLAYPKRLTKGSELLYAEGQKVLNSFQVPGVAEELVHDYRGNTHIVCENAVYGIYISDEQIGIGTLEKEYFLKYIMPIVDTNRSKMYFSNFNKDYPAFDYFAFDQLDSTYSKLINIEDELMMELYRSEYKWVDVRTKLWAKNKELQTGIDAEIWVGANYFTQSIYYKELYAPMFHRNDSVFIFDYYKDKLYTFDYLGNRLDSVGIYHHYQPKSTGWKKDLMQDRETGQIYARFEKNGYTYIGRIDTKTGEIGERVRLEYRWVDKVAVYDNFVYYIYRPYESTQKKYLYKEELPYRFKKAAVPDGDL